MTSEYLYRLHAWPTCSVDEWDNVHSGPIEGYMRKYPIIKRTPKGCWISMDEIENPKKFVLLTARKRYACPTEGEAAESFIARKTRYIRILKANIHDAERMIAYAKQRITP